MRSTLDLWGDSRVAAVELPSARYPVDGGVELSHAIGRLADLLDWSDEKTGPFGRVIQPGARVVVKPNWVVHENQGPWGIEPLLTHATLIRAVVEGVLRSEASDVLVGDAPLQRCDFDELLSVTGLDEWASGLTGSESRFRGIRDFRRTKSSYQRGLRVAMEDLVPAEQFVLFDLKSDSLLEPVTDERGSFRVTQYDPSQMVKTHGPGRHQYLVAKDVIEADVIINLPKLKTHKKAGVTCALKNLIGINGNKEFLPHHRVGGSEAGGDCYPGRSWTKRALEFGYDRLNQATSQSRARLWHQYSRVLSGVSRALGDRLGVEGSWSGNDTIWRTCLDLNRILLYGLPEAILAEEPQRKVLHLVDAVVAGQGEGPLSAQPLPLGLLLAGGNAAAVDWVGAEFLGYDPFKIPIAREAFADFHWPVAPFGWRDVKLVGDCGEGGAESLSPSRRLPKTVNYPVGWRDAVRT